MNLLKSIAGHVAKSKAEWHVGASFNHAATKKTPSIPELLMTVRICALLVRMHTTACLVEVERNHRSIRMSMNMSVSSHVSI